MMHHDDQSLIQSELAQWLRGPVPRHLTARLRKHVGKKSGTVTLMVLGVIFAVAGSAFCALFLPWQFFKERDLDKAPPRYLDGIVTYSEATNMSVNEVKVWQYEVTFQDANEKKTSLGYTTGKSLNEGDKAVVRVHPEEADLHCPQGMRMSKGSVGSAVVLLFPVIGVLMLTMPWISRRKRYKLFENGTAADLRVIAMETTSMQVNNQTVHKVTVQLSNLPDTFVVKKYDARELSALNDSHVHQQSVRVVYDPNTPKKFAVVM